ncbi:MAG TPA: hypothetical protein PLQ13_04930, partial [Candidatus Krumholzibacteria bacterium]|nr:hypothetical protein [Candidatus Krumholzibacteria bacterium]
MRPRHLFLLVVLAAALAATTAGAQTGQPFVPQQTWYLDAFGLGVATNTAADSLIVEFDGVPGLTAADHRHPMPPQLASITPASRNYRLSPSRRALYVFGTAADGSGTRIELFVIIPWNGSGLVPVAGTSLADGIAFDGFLDLSPQPMLFFAVSRANFASQQSIWWANLGDGATGTTSGLPAGIASPLTFAPTGIAAFVQHDGTFPGQSTYRLVELCSATLGTLISQTGWPFNDLPAPVAEAWLTDDGSGGPAAGVWRGGTLLGLVPLDDCTSTPPPPEPAVLDIATTAPGSVTAFGHVTYSVRVRNTGAGPSESVFLYVPVPAGAAFASASAGGNYDSLRNRVAYVLGTLPPGYDATHTVTVATDCNSPQLFPAPAFLQIVNAVVATANSVSTTVQPLGSLPGLTITATPSAVPLPPGGTIDYTFTFAAPTTDQPDVVVYAGWGNFADLASFGATGGGVFQDNIGGFQWTGDLAAGVSTQFSIRVVLWECHGTYPSTTSLNHGYPVSYYGACGADAWAPVPAGIPMTPPDLAARIRVHGPQPVRTFPASAGVVDDFALVRPDEPFTVVWEVFNHGTQSHPACSATLDLGNLQPVGSPPFVG